MGGRGASSGRAGGGSIKQITVDFGNGTSGTYRVESNGKVYSIGVGGTPDKEINLSLKDLKANAEKNGFSVKTYNAKEYKAEQERYKKRRAENDKFQNYEWYGRDRSGRIKVRKGMKGH